MTRKEQETLLSYFPRSKATLRLLFAASRDGFSAKAFHEKCDWNGPTVTVVQSKHFNHVFGGYASVPWDNRRDFKRDTDAFIFLLRSSLPTFSSLKSAKWTVKDPDCAVFHHPTGGPNFGISLFCFKLIIVCMEYMW
ncbi:hypothetical protein RFI_24099 [Reticulomyxa filosa]|uniref:TLDc domain-containing protein n=1 Tax=Reticulomyxa filosa TaxID=46433 RepID=X6MGX5_RETFI|nr:hypothetical protein RFI_24099 [Reticulomyxa filosa]|eukprot:ETO13273.1 hypothetical protein RFI_24099 [Reticulomyxa filosa]